MILVQFVICLIFFTLVAHFVYKQVKFLSAINNVPGPWAHISLQLFGILWKFYETSEAERLRTLKYYAEKYPKIGKVFFGHMLFLYMHDPDMIQKVYSSQKCLEKPYFYKYFGFGDGLITAKVKSWKLHRKILNNAFSLKNLQEFIPIFDQSSKQLVKEMEKNVGKGLFNILEYATKCTLDSICATSFGINVKAQENKLTFNTHLQRIHELTAVRMFNVHLHLDFLYRFSKYWKDDVIARSHCLKFGENLIKKHKEKCYNDLNFNHIIETTSVNKKSGIFVEHLLKCNNNNEIIFTDDQIRDHVLTILSAGNETTALAISFATLFLAMHQEVQDRLFIELQEMYGNGNTLISYENLRDLKYLDMVVKETLRLAPSVPLISRVMTEDTSFENGVFLPKGTHTLVVIYALHRLKCYWGPDADKFNPENFLPENVAKRHPYCYMPFSSGIRNCIGQNTTLKMEDLEFRLDVALMLTNSYLVEINRR